MFAQADADIPSHFIRVLIIPPEFKGKRTVQYVNREDDNKPRLQTDRVYCETLLSA